jgi:hypothetical protein
MTHSRSGFSYEAVTNRESDFRQQIAALTAERDALWARCETFAKAAMYGAQVIEQVPYFNGVKLVAAYTRFDEFWMTQLTAEDMTFMRSAVGLPEPIAAGEGSADG